MNTHRVTRDGPAHITVNGRTVCGGSHAGLPPGDAWPCRACQRTAERRRRAMAA